MGTILLNDANSRIGFSLLPKSITDLMPAVIVEPAKGNQANWVGLAKSLNLPDTFDLNSFRKRTRKAGEIAFSKLQAITNTDKTLKLKELLDLANKEGVNVGENTRLFVVKFAPRQYGQIFVLNTVKLAKEIEASTGTKIKESKKEKADTK